MIRCCTWFRSVSFSMPQYFILSIRRFRPHLHTDYRDKEFISHRIIPSRLLAAAAFFNINYTPTKLKASL